MKSVSTPVLNALKTGHSTTVGLLAYAEWNHNMMYKTLVDNTPNEDENGYDTELFPIESITRGNRPEKSGICKAIAGQAYADYNYHTTPSPQRYYIADVDDEYKYWQSPVTSDGSNALANTAPHVLYTQENGTTLRTVKTNKINICVENSFANPTTFNIQIKKSTTSNWESVATQAGVTFPATGRISLWYNGTNWTTTKNTDNVIDVHAVRLVVTGLNKPNAYFNLIELGLGLELNVTADVAAMSASFSMGEQDFITPLGTISSNTGQISLFNDERKYSGKNPSSVLFGLLDKGVKFSGSYRIDSDTIQDFVMYSDTWDESDSETVVALVDYSRFFQDVKPRRVLYNNIPVQEAIWRLCDLVGFNSYKVTTIDTEPNSKIDIFWTDAEKSIWETFQELSRATQTAIYFDSYGVLQVKTRGAAFNDAQTPVDTLTREGSSTRLPNIISLSDAKQYEANKVVINYKPAKFSEREYYVIPYEQVWEPEGTVTLRASELTVNMTDTSMEVHVAPQDAETWPFKGKFQIEGEWVEYEGKEYSYFDKGVANKVIVKSQEEKEEYDDRTDPAKIHLNKFTGKMVVTVRGAYNTQAQAHSIAPTGWRTQKQKNYGAAQTSSGSLHNAKESCITLNSGGNMNDYLYYNRGSVNDEGFYYMGTSIRINKGSHKSKVGGIFFNADGGLGTGYFVEVSASINFKGQKRKTGNEITVYSMKANGTKKVFGGEKYVIKDKSKGNDKDSKNTKKVLDIGAQHAVVLNNYVDIDVVFQPGTTDRILVYANGTLLIDSRIPAGEWQHARKGLWGLYTRGNSNVSFDYAYAVENAATTVTPSQPVQYLDRIAGGFRANQWMVDWVYQSRMVKKKKRSNKKVRQNYNQRYYTEFGPILHEIRDFEVKFNSDEPVVQSKLYLSNYSQCIPLSYSADNSTARFTLANISRDNAILSGDDELTALGQGTIGHKLFVYGRPVLLEDEKILEKQDDEAIRRRGIIETDYDSPWIQSEAEAERFATWLVDHWRTSDSVLTVEVFGNPTYELGDVVQVNYRELSGTYYITEITNAFEGGITTNLTLRKT